MQDWPAKPLPLIAAASAAASRSASTQTISGVELPSSSETCVLDAHVADLPRRTGDDGEQLARQPRLVKEVDELDRREWGDTGGLEHGATAGGDRRPDLVRGKVERKVEGRDRRDDPDRNADRVPASADPRRMRVDRDSAPGERARLDRGKGQCLNAAVDFHQRLLQRLADLAGEQAREMLAALAGRD